MSTSPISPNLTAKSPSPASVTKRSTRRSNLATRSSSNIWSDRSSRSRASFRYKFTLIVTVALGLKAHSGWAALVGVGRERGALVVSTRRRIELVDEAWAKQPYHAAEALEPEPARRLVA